MKKAIALLSLCITIFAANDLFAQPKDILGWNNAKWGMTEEQILKTFKGTAVRVEDVRKLDIIKLEQNLENLKPNMSQEEYQKQKNQIEKLKKSGSVHTTIKIPNHLTDGDLYEVEFSFSNETGGLQSVELIYKTKGSSLHS